MKLPQQVNRLMKTDNRIIRESEKKEEVTTVSKNRCDTCRQVFKQQVELDRAAEQKEH